MALFFYNNIKVRQEGTINKNSKTFKMNSCNSLKSWRKKKSAIACTLHYIKNLQSLLEVEEVRAIDWNDTTLNKVFLVFRESKYTQKDDRFNSNTK